MKTLIKFSIKRRMLNRATILFYAIVFTVMGCLLFGDKILAILLPSVSEPTPIKTIDIDWERFADGFEKIIKYDDEASVLITKKEGVYTIQTETPLSPTEKSTLGLIIDSYENGSHEKPVILYKTTAKNNLNLEIVFSILTTLYFLITSLSSSAMSEVIMEKTSNVLEMVCSVIHVKTYFVTKVILGLMMMTIQLTSLALIFSFWVCMRQTYDQGEGLVDLLQTLGILDFEGQTFIDIIKNLNLSQSDFINIGCAFLILMVGIATIQIILLVLAVRIRSIEEAGSVHGPLYFLMLCIYYLSIFLNTRYHMTEGWGVYLSLTPLFSMLFLPLRVLVYDVSIYEIAFSFATAIGFFTLVFEYSKYYSEKFIFDNDTKKID
ncbi:MULTISPECIES: ABC transporter permease [unclassified Erysipelothrix]|uniref:ABC transporter permease n=1 Tax=unclassified Erysipelothrix TaxID=2624170 RepID=UPI00190A0531|nr:MULTISPECIES: ABC transporter permease [unclassified Erysipelothrix]MBK2402245.1 ABC transporter permease [Erysipelothrix sp. strain 2 (EsS2-6-Brazil)]MBK2404256.1 ABC transporter permease [Erysipelothrix sp. strain 2 (EsS2-7-Brazil)]